MIPIILVLMLSQQPNQLKPITDPRWEPPVELRCTIEHCSEIKRDFKYDGAADVVNYW